MQCLALCLPAPPLTRDLKTHSVVGGKGRPTRRHGARCKHHLCCARLCICLHHLLVTFSGQPATACDPSGARGQLSHRPGGEAMAAASPGTSLKPVLGTCNASGARGAFCRRQERTTDAAAGCPMHAPPMLCSPMRWPAPPVSNVQRCVIHRELGASHLNGRVARRWWRPLLAPALSLCLAHAMHRELGADSVVGWKGRPMRRQGTRCTHHLCCARLCVGLHHLSVTCSSQPATACDPSGARGQSSQQPVGEAMAAAVASPGTSL